MKGTLFALPLLLAASAKAAIILEYTTAASTTSTTIAANANTSTTVTADDLTAGSGLTANSGSTYNFRGWDTASTSFADAVAADDIWTWGFDVTTPGTTITLTTMNIRLDRSGSGPDDFEIQASVNGGAAVSLLTHDYADSGSGVTFTDVDISALGSVSTGDSVVFTLGAFNSESAAGTFDLETVTFPGGTDSIQINGIIPEPSVSLLGGLGLLALLRRRR